MPLPGAWPAQLESDEARKTDNSIATLQGLKHITPRVQDASAALTAEFRLDKPVWKALDDMRLALAQVRGDLPGDVRDPNVNKVDLAGQPVLAFNITSEHMDPQALCWRVDHAVAMRLLAARGVRAVTRVGGVNREVQVALEPERTQGRSRLDAQMDACHKRARPIIMATLAMGAGMLPIAIAIGIGFGAVDPGFRSPMVAALGGLITSTVPSLLVIPAFFTGFDGVGLWLRRAGRRQPGARGDRRSGATTAASARLDSRALRALPAPAPPAPARAAP